ncbi:alpha/beta hydrolase [Nodosilinea sp. E11]|uniref:alpha/beta fold hydrolase n=1 Tax=Nodosilinea sp. E11 TaxID=3037479 RepID=UPI002934D8A6|nr:alpha/beta hydrolase [Nodosilinea sp. E11]WOD40557.1 alpha/beta hydrolase [Nodosilinea sp. E11]
MTTGVSPQHNFLSTNGVRLHYVRQGQGPLMLFLHGFPEFWYSWRHQLNAFAADYTCVALDLRGYNDSDKPEGLDAYRLDVLVDDVRGAIEALGYDRAILVGHDWGGAIAWAFAYTYPQLLESLIVMNIPHPAKFAEGLRTPQQLIKSWYIGLFQLPLLPELLLQAGNYWLIEQALRGMAIDKSTFSDADLDRYKTAAAKPGALTAMVNYYRAFALSGQWQQSWGVLAVPTLMIWGEDDAALGKELSTGTEAYVSNLRLRYIPQCSHWVQQERPQQVNAFITEFLALQP